MEPGSDPPGPGGRSARRSPQAKNSDGTEQKKKGVSLQEVKMRGRLDRSREEEELSHRLNLMNVSSRSASRGTGLVYSEIFTHHQNLWDSSHPEGPSRVLSIMAELQREELLGLCVRVEPREATEEELLLTHTKHYVDLIKSTQTMTQSELHMLSDRYDSVYLHPESFQVSVMAVGSVLQLIDRVMTSDLRNGFAVIRPPGHHAQTNQPNGFCVFNNVGVAARYAQSRHAVSRVLVVDWDVHHGQGIQYLFQEDPSVLYFSIHRFEHRSFWPHLPESDSSFIGTGSAEGRTINLPWNQMGMRDADYIAAFQQVLLPVAYEFQPELVLVSAGFDAAVGDQKGEMCVSPQCFHILTHMLMSLAEGRLVLALEGGYNLQATAEGVAACVRALLGGACPHLDPPTAPSDSALQSISQTISALLPHWVSLQVLGGSLAKGDVTKASFNEKSTVIANLTPLLSNTKKTGLVYDERMMEHENLWDRNHPEQPQRIFKIFSKHQQLGLVDRCQRIPSRLATEDELAMCHSMQHIEQMKATAAMKPRGLHRLGDEFNSIYFNNQSFQCAQLAAGSCFNIVDSLLSGQVSNGVAIVRPPGHHAEKDAACGFCLFNTAALTARYAQNVFHDPLLQVLILDWDVHHGNGTQHLFEEDDSVLYISLHRYDNGIFFPSSEDAATNRVGVAKGVGFNVNVAWSGGQMGDSDYLAAFHHVVMPIAREFNPGLVLVSAGFDAARGDPLGGYHVTPEGYAHLTHMLMSLAGGRVLIILEGGYNLTSISDSMAMCTNMLLGDPPPPLVMPLPPPHRCAVATINDIIQNHAPYWKSLRIHTPESLLMALHSPKHGGKRRSKGKGRKSDNSPAHPAGAEVSTFPSECLTSCQIKQSTSRCIPSNQTEQGLEQLVQGLASLDIDQASASLLPVTPMGGAKTKSTDRVGAELQAEGACGWSKPEAPSELACGTETTLYVVTPLTWCPHLDAVKPLPPSGVDVFARCEDCHSESENWTCLTCYQVYCGRYINEHMVVHSTVSEHPVVLSLADLSVWCYLCESYVNNQVLFQAKNAAHLAKFGEQIHPRS